LGPTILILDVGRWQCAVDIVVIVEGECDLFEVIIALDTLRSATCSANRGKQDCRQRSNDTQAHHAHHGHNN